MGLTYMCPYDAHFKILLVVRHKKISYKAKLLMMP